MNPDYPPVEFSKPTIKPRRREKQGPRDPVKIPTAQRREVAKRVHGEIASIKAKTSRLSPDQKRAVFLKIVHDRPLTKGDFAGVGMMIIGEPGAEETMVVVPEKSLSKLEERSDGLAEGKPIDEAKNFKLLDSIKEIKMGDPHDRLSDSLHEEYGDLITRDFLVYEIEISSQKIQERWRRKEVGTVVEEINQRLGNGIRGMIYDSDFRGDGARLMIGSPGAQLKEFVEDSKWWRSISFFDSRPKFQTFSQTLRDYNIQQTSIKPPQPTAETICVIDSGVAAGNPFLNPVLDTDQSRSWVYDTSPTEDKCGHGSGVASLAAYHSIDPSAGAINEAKAWIVSARIMTDSGELDSPQSADESEDRRRECKLLSTILREVVEHYAPLGVKVFVLSFEIKGNCWSLANRREVSRNSWVARTIDQLIREFDVVFCCITGNIGAGDVEELKEAQGYPQYFTSPLAKLLDPGQAALAITAGSTAHSEKTVGGKHRPISRVGQPSPFTRSGPGFGDAIKPDFVEAGGNFVEDTESKRVSANLNTSVLMASGELTPPLALDIGTSFAAPRIAFHVARILEQLKTMPGVEISSTLLRALLASSARVREPLIELNKGENLSLTGFGTPSAERALECQAHSILLYWSGNMKPNHTALFGLHVPRELVGYTGKKRVSVAVAISPPVQAWGIADYLGVCPKFWLFRGDEESEQIEEMVHREEDEKNEANDSVAHITRSEIGITKRTVGTLQSDTFEWTHHKENFSLNDYSLAVALAKPATWLKDKDILIPVAVTVRIEECSGQFSELYAKVRARSGVRVRANA